MSVLSHAVRQQCDRSWTGAPPMLVCKYMDQNGLAAMLATKRLAGMAPGINIKESNTYHEEVPKQMNQLMPLKPRVDRNRGTSGPTVAPQERTYVLRNKDEKHCVYITHGFIPKKIQLHIHTGPWSLANSVARSAYGAHEY